MVVLLAGLFAAGMAAATIQANPATPSTTTLDETTTESSTDETTTVASTNATTVTTTTVGTTTTASTPTTKSPAKAKVVRPVSRPIVVRCLLVGAFAVLEPDRPAWVVGPVAQTSRPTEVGTGGITYPASGSIVTAGSIDLNTRGCGTSGHADVRALSLLGGAITARRVTLAVGGGGGDVTVRIRGLVIGGNPVLLRSGRRLAIENWGYVIAQGNGLQPREVGALAVHLTASHAGLAAGTVLLVSFAGLPQRPVTRAEPPAARRLAKPVKHARPAAHKRHRPARKRPRGRPLKLTPPLGLSHYVFPVAGRSDYIDTYGAFRGDVPGNWHHGDDIFAGLGAPVLAVADGTLNRVGWERLGGWRLWVRDTKRNQFYYAHLSGYSPLALHSKHVMAGDVIGFIGNTGDAFTTSPHLHFEIHPHSLLQLKYNGAVNPTNYLDHWRHVTLHRTPRPAHPPFPGGAVRAEARFVWRELLAARGLISHAPSASERPRIHVPGSDAAAGIVQRRLTALSAGSSSRSSWLALLAVMFGAAAAVCVALLLRRRREWNASERH
jgi:murein DD-endopeptidase MepM/ murein hydrolase activator NlpD